MNQTMNQKLEQARLLIGQFDQKHLLKFFDQLSALEQETLLDQILNIDFELINSLYQNLALKHSDHSGEEQLTPLQPQDWAGFDPTTKKYFWDLGLELIRQGKTAAVLVAGGQGTRLGHCGPKGTYNIGLPSEKSLFQLQAERLLNLAANSGKTIPWYIMTSADNHQDTTQFFRDHNFFGYPEAEIFFFQQDQLPVIDAAGKLLLSEPGKISLGPNGNGGCFLALDRSGALADMKRRGVEWVLLYGIDNALVRVCDPALIGFAAANKLPSASKTVAKVSPEESVGVLCYRNNRPAIIEYTEIPTELTYERDPDGNLLFGNANILTHLFRRDFLEQNAGSNLPYHVAHKKIATINSDGNPINPDTPNAYKFELFMFDIFPLLSDMAALQVKREAEFAPVKNKEGNDSPETARNLLYQLHQSWLLSAGVSAELLTDRAVEISPLISYAGEGLKPEEIENLLRQNSNNVLEIN